MNGTYKITDTRYEKIMSLISKLNKRAVRLNQPQITVKKLGTELVSVKNSDDTRVFSAGVKRLVHILEISGETPGVPGWDFIAQITHEENGNLVRAFSEVPEFYRTADNGCDHCHQNRARVNTYILRSEADGHYKQVGSNCLKDFTGYADVHAIAALCEEWSDLSDSLEDDSEEDDFLGSGAGKSYFDAVTYMSYICMICDGQPFVSRSAAQIAQSLSTADLACDAMIEGKLGEPTDAQRELAVTVIKWAQEFFNFHKPESKMSDYDWNCSVICFKESLSARDLALFASLYSYYNRELGRKIENEKRAAESVSQWLSAEGEKIKNVKATVTLTKEIEGFYGTTYLYKFSADGNIVTWFSSVNYRLDVSDEVVILSATVKKNDIFNGEKQTVITRAKLELADGSTWNKQYYHWNPAPEAK